MTINNEYTKGNWLDYLHHQNWDKFIGMDLSRQTILLLLKKLISQKS